MDEHIVLHDSTTMTTTIEGSFPLGITTASNHFNETVVIHFSRPATIFAAVCASIFTVVGIAGNLLTVVALLRCPKLRSHATTLFVISLAISDLLFAAVNLPLTASRYVQEEWVLGATVCRLFPFFFYGNVAASLMNMVAITINRYVLISCHANYSRIYSRFNIFLMIVFVWGFSFGIMIPPLVEIWGTMGLNEKTFSCTILKKDGTSPKKFLMLFGFMMPCIVITCCYSAIFCKVRQSRKNVQQHLNGGTGPSSNNTQIRNQYHTNSVQSAQRREDIRLTKMMLTIFLCFVVCFLPLMLVNVVDEGIRYPFLHIPASVLAWASAVINPFIYAFKNRQYQQAFAKLFQNFFPSSNNGRPSSSNPRAVVGTGGQFTNGQRACVRRLKKGGLDYDDLVPKDGPSRPPSLGQATSSSNKTTTTTTSGGTKTPSVMLSHNDVSSANLGGIQVIAILEEQLAESEQDADPGAHTNLASQQIKLIRHLKEVIAPAGQSQQNGGTHVTHETTAKTNTNLDSSAIQLSLHNKPKELEDASKSSV
ncbi:protein trapped in endoderm-1-like isoform X2 [Tigriopus californicus]|uniref:protein trapped in endoderm-1-like isoform X2 n=1 Tax=Tigriopus californicus TaxID=6832 RepID=UPI0027DA10BB|nr:protein trapped in endoderm-1-like isoform X2 [Tigriopus californicus]